MRPFRARDGRYVTTIDRDEVRILADLIGQVRTMLADRAGAADDDPLAALTGLQFGSSTAPADPALARLLPDFRRDAPTDAAALRVRHEREVVAAKDDAAAATLDSLPPRGGRISLDDDAARSWAAALNDIRLALGVRLQITDEDTPPPAATAPPGSGEYAMFAAYQWVSAIQESLVQAMLDGN